MLEERTKEAISEAFEQLMEGINSVELPDSLQRQQFELVKNELKNLKRLYYKAESTEFKDTQRWLAYSIEQISNEMPPSVMLRFEQLFTLLKQEKV